MNQWKLLTAWGVGVLILIALFFTLAIPQRLPKIKSDALKPSGPYNLIVLSVHILRADHMGTFGYWRDTTPDLDKFAKQALIFEQAFAQSAFTLASQASFHTSQYPAVHGAEIIAETPTTYTLSGIPQEKNTLAEILKQWGYKTAAFVGAGELRPDLGFDQGFNIYDMDGSGSFKEVIPKAFTWIEENKSDKFFLFLKGYDLHAPYHPPAPYEHMFDETYNGVLADHEKFRFDYGESDPRSILQLIKKVKNSAVLQLKDKTIPLSRGDLNHVIAHYDGDARYTDSLLEPFFAGLKEKGLYNNTIVIVFSSHGEGLADDMERVDLRNVRLFGHGRVYDEVVRVPLLIRHPEFQPRRISALIELIDVYPTILEFLGIPLTDKSKAEIQGESMVPLITGKIKDSDFKPYVFGEMSRGSQYVRTNEWKLIKFGGSFELYHLREDPKERYNVVSQYPQIVKQLDDVLSEWVTNNLLKKNNLSL